GEFLKALELNERKFATIDKPRFGIFDELDQITGALFESKFTAPTFEEVLDRVRSMDQKNYLVQYVTYVLSPMEPHFICQNDANGINECQYFSDFILPALNRAFNKYKLRLDTFEIVLLGYLARKNQGKNAMVEVTVQPHKADATPEGGWKPDCNCGIFRTRLFRRKKAKRPLQIGARHAVQLDTECHFRAMNFQECFRLFKIRECLVPTSTHQLKDRLPKFLKSCLAFATLVMDEVDRRRSLEEVDEDSSEEMKLAIENLDMTSKEPPKIKKRRLIVDEESESNQA
ncbi:hypothetical protein BGX27_003429, partial [Mortierella sp. AM989]